MHRPPRAARRRPASTPLRWFQLHLSTALLLTIGAGVLMSLNFQKQAHIYSLVQRASTPLESDTYFYVRIESHGWPFWTDAQFTRVEKDGSDFGGYTDFTTSTELFKLVRAQLGIPETPTSLRALNVATGSAILLALAIASEFIIRQRRSKRAVPSALAGENAATVSAEATHAESSALPEIDPSAH